MTDISLSEQFRIVARKWVEADKAATMREETKSAFLSQHMLALGDMAVSKAEMTVKGGQEWAEYIKAMVEDRSAANLLKVQLDYIKMQFQEQQSHEASKRAEMRL
tara:strand:- start:332 stop:646 length:315 start_codon:yes stop_codon:yes gene_type:complete